MQYIISLKINVMRLLITALVCLLLLSCESTHTSRKIIQNESSYSFQIHYFSGYYDMDSIYTIPINSYVDIELTQKLGNKPCALPSSPCSITENDTLIVLIDNYMFTGDFRDEYSWNDVSTGCKQMILDFRNEVLTNIETVPLFEDEPTQWLGQMYSFSIPNHINECGLIKSQLINEYNIEIPVFVWAGKLYIRISLNGYNSEDDLHRLLAVLPKIISTY